MQSEYQIHLSFSDSISIVVALMINFAHVTIAWRLIFF